jgi:replication fork protection complex subunit Tof1/Swi1
VNDHCIDTFRSLLDFYIELRPEQIKRVLTFFHRIFVKRKQQVILYRLDICELLSRMMNDEINIAPNSSIRKHLEDFVKYYTNELVKALKRTPALYIEVSNSSTIANFKLLFSKLPSTLYFLQHGEEEIKIQPKRPRAAAELEVRPGRSREDQIAVVVAALLDDQKSEALDSIKTVLANIVTEIRAWEHAEEAHRIINGASKNENEIYPRQSKSIAHPTYG